MKIETPVVDVTYRCDLCKEKESGPVHRARKEYTGMVYTSMPEQYPYTIVVDEDLDGEGVHVCKRCVMEVAASFGLIDFNDSPRVTWGRKIR